MGLIKNNLFFLSFLLTIFFHLTVSIQVLAKELIWNFPLPRTHTGMLIGNGTQGLMIWGEDNQLNITIGHQGFWDHRDGNDVLSKLTFSDLKKLLYNEDEDGLEAAFAIERNKDEPSFGRPKQLGGGRLEIIFPDKYRLQRGVLNLSNGEATILIINEKNGSEESITIRQAITDEIAWVDLPPDLNIVFKLVPTWEHIKEELIQAGVSPPKYWALADMKGFTQTLPDDKPLGIGYKKVGDRILIGSNISDSPKERLIHLLNEDQIDAYLYFANNWWNDYWESVPKVDLPDSILQEFVDYGLYKQACVTPPHAPPAGLQGPFVEEYQLIPWSNDYHFNINVQMMYTPALASNRPEHFNPLWNMIQDWMPELKKKGESFFEQKNALMIPHAVDDRGNVNGSFWSGVIDHACTAWIAYMAWQHYRYTMDERILEKTAWPLLSGAFEGFWAMMEEVKDEEGKIRYSLPVSVSPEYRGRQPDAWGRDASFQLAAFHKVAEILPKAARILNKPGDERWMKVQKYLPPYTTIDNVWYPEYQRKGERIALWQDLDLEGSHRHHSHLAGIYPFRTIDPYAPIHKTIVRNTMRNWVFKGDGNWCGWSYPWAATIWARLNNPEAAVMNLHFFHENYVNKGRGTVFRAMFKGSTLISDVVWAREEAKNREIMQLDAGFDAMNAVFELLVQNRGDEIVVLPVIHKDWKELSFDGILTEGAFLISAEVSDGKTKKIVIKSKKGGIINLRHGFEGEFSVDGEEVMEGDVFTSDTNTGQKIILEYIIN